MEFGELIKAVMGLALSASLLVFAIYLGDKAKNHGGGMILNIWVIAAILIAAAYIVENQGEEFVPAEAIKAATVQCPKLTLAIQTYFKSSEEPIARSKFIELKSIACKQEVGALQLRALEEKPELAKKK